MCMCRGGVAVCTRLDGGSDRVLELELYELVEVETTQRVGERRERDRDVEVDVYHLWGDTGARGWSEHGGSGRGVTGGGGVGGGVVEYSLNGNKPTGGGGDVPGVSRGRVALERTSEAPLPH